MTQQACRAWRELLGVAAIGRLATEETVALRAHLEGCPGCRAEARRLEATASLLSLADVSRLDRREVPPADLLGRIEAAVDDERGRQIRSRRTRWVAAAAGIAAVLAVFIVLALPRMGDPDSLDVSLVATEGVTANARAHLAAKPWGTEILLEAQGLPAQATYRVWLERADGERVPAGTFAGAGPNLTMTLAASLPADDTVAVGISVEDGTTLLYGRIDA